MKKAIHITCESTQKDEVLSLLREQVDAADNNFQIVINSIAMTILRCCTDYLNLAQQMVESIDIISGCEEKHVGM